MGQPPKFYGEGGGSLADTNSRLYHAINFQEAQATKEKFERT